jgi:GT2 family glycosyltransferase
MDENFVLFFEDVDLSYRIHKRFQLLLDTRIKVTHLGGMSFGKEYKTLMYGRFLISMNYFFKKHYGKLRQFLLKAFSEVNSSAVITFEYIKKIFNISNDTRLEKHKIYLKLLRNT